MPIADVDYIPKISTNLLYLSWIRQKGLQVTLKADNDGAGIVVVVEKGSGTIVMRVIEVSFGLYEMQLA